MKQHEEFLKAYAEYPSQDNEGYQPDRAGFKAGFGAAWEIQQRRVAQLEEALTQIAESDYCGEPDEWRCDCPVDRPHEIARAALDGEKGKGV